MRLVPVITILSGGQTGVDRAALDAAMTMGTPAGGWCPQGRKAEDGRIPDKYPLRELPGGDYLQRTEQNVTDSDATLIIYFGKLHGGTASTLEFCKAWNKPYLSIDGSRIPEHHAAVRILEFVLRESISRLNVAGPRASGEPKAYPYAFAVLASLLSNTIRSD